MRKLKEQPLASTFWQVPEEGRGYRENPRPPAEPFAQRSPSRGLTAGPTRCTFLSKASTEESRPDATRSADLKWNQRQRAQIAHVRRIPACQGELRPAVHSKSAHAD